MSDLMMQDLNPALSARSRAQSFSRKQLVRLASVVMTWDVRWRTRRQLARLTPEQLKDVGLRPGQAFLETRKPFWRR